MSWPFKNASPPEGFTRHTFKGASEFGFESYEQSFEVVGNEPICTSGVPLFFWSGRTYGLTHPTPFSFFSLNAGFDFVGLIENGNWKSVGTTRGKNVPGAARFAKLDEYLEREKKGAIDSLMLSTVVGVVKI